MRITLILFCVLLFIGQASAIADYHIWDEQNQTATLYKNQQKWITVTNIGIFSDITEHRELLKVTSNYDYSFSALDDFYMGYEIYKGNNKITDLSTTWFLRTTEDYNITINDYGIISNWTSKEVFNNQTGINETVWYWDNQTVIIGNHTEPRSRINESIFNPTNKKIDAGQTLTFIKVTRKRAEVGEFSILLKPVFMGFSIKELTWWNATWGYKKPILINNTGNATVLTNYQVFLNITYDSDMQAEFKDIRVVNDTSGAAVPYWIESKVNSSYANVWFNATSIPASVWTNSTYYLYYGNAAVSDGGNIGNTFIFGDDFSGTLTDKWTVVDQAAIVSGELRLGLGDGSYTDGVASIDSIALGNIIEFNLKYTSGEVGEWGYSTSPPVWGKGIRFLGRYTGATIREDRDGTVSNLISASNSGLFKLCKIILKPTTGYTLYYDNVLQKDDTTWTNPNGANKVVFSEGSAAYSYVDDIRVRKYIAIEPTATLGTEETPPPVTFNQSIYNTGWQTIFINATQNMTSIRSMMNISNVLWIAKWNATSQKFESYKAGWAIQATTNTSAGAGVYLKITNNDTMTRNNGTGNYFWNLSTNWNLVGLDYNGTRTLSQINTSVNSVGNCEANLITYINPVNMTEYIYTCGSANNATVEVSQGQGVWMNATTAISRVRSW